jgi:hypothetical protein
MNLKFFLMAWELFTKKDLKNFSESVLQNTQGWRYGFDMAQVDHPRVHVLETWSQMWCC